ncbi:MAG: LPS export ABC transporter periplasmic protein LptC [Verrucomicrobia bacterium]|nr:LPS export ABC transporter periplasmic protein LptC [Verrucomicrobiota bacterium]MBV9659474.1 LPS export ABC transporter periplasmic protein LptC [Verrucomicrobiota bacterium]
MTIRLLRFAFFWPAALALFWPGIDVKAQSPPSSPATAASPTSTPAGGSANKENKGLNFSIPLPIGETTREIKIPERGPTGETISQLMALSIKRLDADHLAMERVVIDLYKPDGRTDYKISLPTSVFDLRTRVIQSSDPVSISTTNFELQGQRMDFDTATHTGKLIGWVYMKIHNAKELAQPSKPAEQPTPKSDR